MPRLSHPAENRADGRQPLGDTSSLIKGGGQDLTRTDGQLRKSHEIFDEKSREKEKNRERDKQALSNLQKRIKEAIENNKILQQYKNQLLLEMTPEGLRVQIVDEKTGRCSTPGSAQLLPHTRELLHELGKQLNEVPNRLTISGHTDASQYAAGDRGMGNWELSSERANAARRELVGGGMRIISCCGSSVRLGHPAGQGQPAPSG